MLSWQFTFLFDINRASSKKKLFEFQAKKSIDTWFLTTTCNTTLVSECRSCMALILYEQSFESFTVKLAEGCDNPLWKANKHTYFLRLVSNWTPVSSHSFQLQHVFIFPFCPAWNLGLYMSFMHMALLTQYILQNFFHYWNWPLCFNRINFTSLPKKCVAHV